MIFFIKNFMRSITVHFKVNLIIVFDLILCASVVFILLQNYYYLKEKHDEFYYDDRIATTFQLCSDGEAFQKVENDVWNKTNMYKQAIYIYDDINSGEFALYKYMDSLLYLDGIDESTKARLGVRDKRQYLPALSVSEFADKGLRLKLSEGRWFTRDEFDNLGNLKYYPIVLGNDYESTFEVGDIIKYNGELGIDEAVVVGFLDTNLIIETYGMDQEVDFNKIVIFPDAGDFPRTDFDNDYVNRQRARMITSGFLFSPDEDIDVQKYINQIVSRYGYYTVEAYPINGTAFSETKTVSERNMYLIGILAVLTTVICTISLGGVLYNRTLDDRRTYCIYMSVGIPLYRINLALIAEMLIWIALSLFPVTYISIIEFNAILIPIWQVVLFEVIILGMAIAPSLYLNTKCNLDFLIRDQQV